MFSQRGSYSMGRPNWYYDHPPACTCDSCVRRRASLARRHSRHTYGRPSHKNLQYDRSTYQPKSYKAATRSLLTGLGKTLIFFLIITIAVLIVASVCMFISTAIKGWALAAILVFGAIFLAFCLQSFAHRRLTFARFFLVSLFSLIFIMLASAYLDIRTFGDVKNYISAAFSQPKGQFRENIDLLVQRTDLKIETNNTADKPTPAPTTDGKTTTKKQADEKHVYLDGGVLVGADGHRITLRNNPQASDPSWEQLKTFLRLDDTDQIPYDLNKFVCADFAEKLHNNAEIAGIRAAYVCIKLGPSSYYPVSGGHALNAFQTTDRGLVYIDCTGFKPGVNADKIVDVVVGQEYVPRSIFPQPGWSSVWFSMGKVIEIEAIEW